MQFVVHWQSDAEKKNRLRQTSYISRTLISLREDISRATRGNHRSIRQNETYFPTSENGSSTEKEKTETAMGSIVSELWQQMHARNWPTKYWLINNLRFWSNHQWNKNSTSARLTDNRPGSDGGTEEAPHRIVKYRNIYDRARFQLDEQTLQCCFPPHWWAILDSKTGRVPQTFALCSAPVRHMRELKVSK